MSRNLGATTLKRRRRPKNAMSEFDRLPAELRGWVATAILPWRPQSVRRAYDKALKQTRDASKALEELDRLQEHRISQDARRLWGEDHPYVATPPADP